MMIMTPRAPLNSAREITFAYEDDNFVLHNLSLDVFPGHKYAFVGPNGSGKTTLASLLAGILFPRTGIISYREDMWLSSDCLSVAYVCQQLSVFPSLTVAQHFQLAPPSALGSDAASSTQYARMADCLLQVGANFSIQDCVGELSFAQHQILEIALALWRNTQVLILDEPTSALDSQSVSLLFETLEGLSAKGVAIILISHNPAEVHRLGATVLQLGGSTGQISRDSTPSRTVARDSSKNGTLAASIRIRHHHHKQEYGVPLYRCKASIIAFDDAYWRARTWLAAIHHQEDDALTVSVSVTGQTQPPLNGNGLRNVRYISCDRKRFGLFPDLSTWRNFLLVTRTKSLFTQRRSRKALDAMLLRYSIVMPSWHHPISTLSGGNQQKLLLASILESAPSVLIAEEPLLGLDAQAQHAVLLCFQDYLAAGGTLGVLTCFPAQYDWLSSEVREFDCTDWFS